MSVNNLPSSTVPGANVPFVQTNVPPVEMTDPALVGINSLGTADVSFPSFQATMNSLFGTMSQSDIDVMKFASHSPMADYLNQLAQEKALQQSLNPPMSIIDLANSLGAGTPQTDPQTELILQVSEDQFKQAHDHLTQQLVQNLLKRG